MMEDVVARNAVRIIYEMRARVYRGSENTQNYIAFLEVLLECAIEDALKNANRNIQVQELVDGGKEGSEQRALAFLKRAQGE